MPRLSQLCQARQLKDVVQCNLFPSADMILSMSKEYGTYAEQRQLKASRKTEADMLTMPVWVKRHATLDSYNREYMKWKRQQMMLKQSKNFIQVCRLTLLKSDLLTEPLMLHHFSGEY